MQLNKYFLLILTACTALLFSSGFSAQTKAAISDTNQPGTPGAEISTDNIPKPKIVFESKLLDFGKIGPLTKVEGEFRFRNAGNAVLEVSKISQCCGIVTSLENEKSKYEPGEKGAIKVSYTATTRTGVFTREPIVYSNDPVDPNLELMVTLEVVNKVSAKPDKLKLFLDEDNAKCPKLTISSIDNQPFSIKGIQSTGNSITAAFDPNAKATQFELDLKVDMAKLEQNMKGDVDLILTHPEMKMMTIPFDVLSKFAVNPPLIIALNSNPGEPIVRKIWIFNNYNEDFEIESVSSKNKYISVLKQDKINNGYQFEIQIMPPPAVGKRNFSDELYIQIKNGEKLKIDLNGYYTPPKSSTP